MGEQSTIKVLNSIYGLLQQVVRNQTQSTTNKQDNKNQRTVSDLNKGSLSNTNISNSSSSDIPKAKISVADINALSGVPKIVLAIAGLNGRTMRNFNSVMNSLIQTITSFSKLDKTTTDGLKGIESLANGLDKLANTRLVKLGISLAIVNATGIGKNFEKFVTEISSAINDKTIPDEKKITAVTEFITKVTPNIKKLALMAPLMPMFVLSAKMMSPGIKAYAKSIEALNNVKDPENAAKILSEMNTLVKSSAVLLGSTVAIGIAIKKVGAKEIFEGLAVNAGIILAVSGLAIAVAKAGSIMGRRSRKALDSISEFVGETMVVTSGIVLLSVAAGARAEQIKAGLPLVAGIFLGVSAIAITIGVVGTRINRRGRRGIRSITNFAASMILVTGALVLLSTIVTSSNDAIKNSFILLGGVILATGALALVAAATGAVIKLTKPFSREILKIAVFGTALVLGTVLLGALIQQSGQMLAIGIGGVSAVIIAYGAAILIPALAIGALAKLGAPLMLQFTKIAAFSLAITLGTILVGQVIKLDIEQSGGILNSALFYGTAGVSATILAYGTLITTAGRVVSIFSKGGEKALLDVMKIVGLGLIITAATVFVGNYLRGNELAALEAFAGLTAIVTEAVLIAKYASSTRSTIDKGIIDFRNVILLMGSGIVVLGAIVGLGKLIGNLGGGDYWKGFAYVSSVFGLLTLIVGEAVLISNLASKNSTTMVNGAKSLLLAEGILLASEVVLFGAVMIAKQLDKDTIGKVTLTFVGMGIIVNGAASLAKLASKKRSVITKGAASLLLAESIILGSAVVLGSVVLLTNKLEEVGYDKAAITLGAMIGVVGLSAGLALVASKLPKATITSGLVTLGMIELLLIGSAVALGSIVLVTNKMKELGDGDLWKGFGQVNITLLTITELMVAFTGLATAATFALPFIAGGVAAIAMLDIFALGLSLFTATVVKTVNRASELGENPQQEIKKITKVLKAFGDVAGVAALGIPTWILGSAGFAAMLPMILSMSVASFAIIGVKNRIQKAGIENVSELGTFAKSLSSIFTYDNFKLPLNVIQRLRLLAQYSDMKPVFKGLRGMADGVSKLVMSVGGMDGNENIIPIVGHDSSGKPIYGKPVNMPQVAKSIVEAVTIFSGILSTDLAKLSSKENKDLLKSFESLSTILEPISNFATALASFEAGGPGKIRAIRFDENGKQVNTPYVDVVSVAKTIGSSITAFVGTLFGTESANKWIEVMSSGYEVIMDKRGKKVIGEKKSNAEIAMGVLSTILDPVSNFVDTLTKFEEGDSGTIVVPIYDKDGNISGTRKVNVENVARLIASAVSTFANTLFGPGAANEWLNIITEGGRYVINEKKGEATYLESSTEKAMGALATLITPVVSFANVLAMFGEAAEAGNLLVYTQDGKSHTVNVVTAASAIGTAIGSFVSNLNSKLDAESLDFLNTNSEVLSKVFSSFANSIQNISSIEAKDLDSKIDGISKVFDFIASKGTTETSILVGKLQSILEGISSPLNDFVNTFIQISTNDLGTNVDKFSTSIKTLNKTIQDTDALTGKTDVNKLSKFFTDLFGKSINEADLSGIDTIKSKFGEYEELLKSISSIQITDASFASLHRSTSQLIVFGANLTKSAESIAHSIEPIGIVVTNKDKIITFINLLSSDNLKLRLNVNQLTAFSKAFENFFLKILEIADEINVESINVLDVNSGKIVNFINSIATSLTDNKVNPAAMTGFNNEFKKFVASIVSISNVDLTTASTDIITIKNSFEEYSDTIKSLNEIELAGVANTNEFNKSLDSLFTNILSMADKNKVVQSVQKTINLTTTSLTKLDNAFIKKNNDRIKELNKLNDTLKDLKDRLDDSSTGLGQLVDLVQALNRADTEKAKELLGEIGKTSTPKKGLFGGGNKETAGESSGETTSVNAGLSANEITNAVAAGIAKAFEGAQLTVPKIKIGKDTTGNTSIDLEGGNNLTFELWGDDGYYNTL